VTRRESKSLNSAGFMFLDIAKGSATMSNGAAFLLSVN
jgi:hypothetical protein